MARDSDTYDDIEAAKEAEAQRQATDFINRLQVHNPVRGPDGDNGAYSVDGEEDWGFGVGTIDLPWKGQLFRFVDSDNPETEQYVNLSLIAGVTVQDGYLYLSANDEVVSTGDEDTIARFWDQWDIV